MRKDIRDKFLKNLSYYHNYVTSDDYAANQMAAAKTRVELNLNKEELVNALKGEDNEN